MQHCKGFKDNAGTYYPNMESVRTYMPAGRTFEPAEDPLGQRQLIGKLLDYAERFAQANNEPEGGHYKETIRKATAWFETGSATIDPNAIMVDLIEYVERFAESNDEPAEGRCRKLLTCARGQSPDAIDIEELRDRVLNTVYEQAGFEKIEGFRLLAARHRKTNVGIFVVNGNFGRDQFKCAIVEAKAAGLSTPRMYVYGQTASYSGPAICFSKFDEIGIVN